MKLHEANQTPNARRVHIFMAEKGIDIDRVDVDIRGGENLSEAYRAKNPAGRVPTLELDDGTFIAESVAICRYLEGIHPSPNLFGADAKQAAVIEMWGRRAEINFMMDVAGAFRNITGFFKDRETCVKEWGQVCAARAPLTLEIFDAQLADNEYLAGSDFSIADITMGAALGFARQVKMFELPELPNLLRWEAQLNERESFSAN